MTEGRQAVEYVLQRHSAREFLNEPVEPEDVDLLMEALRSAPSAGNVQPWFFYAVASQDVQSDLATAANRQYFIEKASLVFVICADPELSATTYKDRGRDLYCYQDSGAAVENLLIVANMLGYGACWVGSFDEDAVREVLNIPDHLRPVAIVPVGPSRPVTDFPDRRPGATMFKIVK